MDEEKSLICVFCGSRFYVRAEDYERRCEEQLCDACQTEREAPSETDVDLRDVAQRVGRIVDRGLQCIQDYRNRNKNTTDKDGD